MFGSASRLAFYAPFDGELDCTLLLERAQADRKQCYLPSLAGRRLVFREATAARIDNSFGIREPDTSATIIDVSRLDLIFIPVVGFDLKGHRLGMGQGFYDRALAPVATSPCPMRIGIAWDCQEVEAITPTAHDVVMHAVVTESRWVQPQI